VPLSVAELIARWHASDPVRALSAARGWVRGTKTVQSIRDAMEESLPKGHGGLVGAASERAYRAAALEQVTSVVQTLTGAVQDLTGSSILSLNTRQRDPESGLKYDFIFEIRGKRSREGRSTRRLEFAARQTRRRHAGGGGRDIDRPRSEHRISS
jgi:hypothetical protein